MINKQQIQELLQQAIAQMPEAALFEVSVSVSPKNEIKVYIDGMQGVNIDRCVEVSRFIESRLDRETEDFELTVSSAGLDQPLRVPAQYLKNKGKEVKVVTSAGEMLKGIILEADGEMFVLKEEPKKISRSAKKKQAENGAAETDKNLETGETIRTFRYSEIKETKIVISFK